MNLNDGNQIRHYTEAERLLEESARVLKEVDAMLPGSPRRERLENRLSHLEAQALAHAHLAGLVQPERSAAQEAPVRTRRTAS